MTIKHRTGIALAAIAVVATAAGAAFVLLPRTTPADPADRDATWYAQACAAAQTIDAERTPAATRALDFELRNAADGAALRSVTIAHLDALELRLTPLLALFDQPPLPAAVEANGPAIAEARTKRTAARVAVVGADPTAVTIDAVTSDAIYEADEAEGELLAIACPPQVRDELRPPANRP